MLQTIFEQIPDPRRGQGKMYDMASVLLTTVLAILSGAFSYRKVHTFIEENFKKLKESFHIKWKKVPGYTTIRNILLSVDPQSLEEALRKYSKHLMKSEKRGEVRHISIDGKEARHSFDNFNDQKAIQILGAFLTKEKIIMAHEEIKGGEKTNEIPKAQTLITDLGIKGCVFTMDAMHCQKKL